MKFTVNQAAEIVGVVRQTMYKHIKNRGISTDTNSDGELVIDQSELIRVYGNDTVAAGLARQHNDPPVDTPRQATIRSQQPKADAVERVRLETEVAKYRALTERVEEELTYVKGLLETEKSERRQATKLLEDLREKGSRAEELEATLKAMESRLDGFEKERRERQERLARARRTRLEKEREAFNNRPWYQRIFA